MKVIPIELEKNKLVYDISLDGTVVNALGANVLSNTDGFNFQLPKKFRYTREQPYVSNGGGRNTKEGKSYIGIEADVAEFEDLFLNTTYNGAKTKYHGLGIDECVPASINLSRKNYMDKLDDGSIKLVGNTIKSRRLATYIDKFITKASELLLNNKGQEFIDYYYEYLSKIYNYQIPLKDIAAKGKIKKSLKEYLEDCNTFTKSGSKKSRQVWYELALKANMNVKLDDTIYYINCGTKKGEGDVKRVVHQFTKFNGEEEELTAKVKREILTKVCEEQGLVLKGMKEKQKKELLKPYISREEDEIIINCKMVPNEIIESVDDIMVNDEIEYNVPKYVEQFNKRITPLLVCFHPNIRDRILITNPDDRPYFTEKECELCSGFPNKETDQDTYEALMKPERKEVEFWLSIDEKPPFVEECNIPWDDIVNDYKETKKREDDELFQLLNKRYFEALENLNREEYKEFEEEGVIPKKIDELMLLNSSDLCFYFKELPNMKPTSGGYIFEDLRPKDMSEEEFEFKRTMEDSVE